MSRIASMLVIDDEALVLQTLRKVAQFTGIENVTACDTVAGAESEMEKQTFDMIICDFRILADNGVKLIARMRAKGIRSPVLFISGVADTRSVIEASQMENTDFLSKPFSLAELRARIEKLSALPE